MHVNTESAWVCEQTHHPPASGTIQFVLSNLVRLAVWAHKGVFLGGTLPKQSPLPKTSLIVETDPTFSPVTLRWICAVGQVLRNI